MKIKKLPEVTQLANGRTVIKPGVQDIYICVCVCMCVCIYIYVYIYIYIYIFFFFWLHQVLGAVCGIFSYGTQIPSCGM